MTTRAISALLIATGLTLGACSGPPISSQIPITRPTDLSALPDPLSEGLTPTPLPTRQNFEPGELVDYVAQSGDTLPGLAARFNTTVPEIMDANPLIPPDATTMPPGLPMRIPIYFRSLWGSSLKIIPNSGVCQWARADRLQHVCIRGNLGRLAWQLLDVRRRKKSDRCRDR